MFSWFPGTCEHRFLYVHQGWIKVKAEHRPTCSFPDLACLGWWSYSALLKFAEQASKWWLELESFSKREEKGTTPPLQQGGTWLIHLQHSQSRGQHESCSSGMSWRVRGNWCKSKPTRALSCSAWPFSQRTVLVSFVKTSDSPALTHLSLCSAVPAWSLPPAPISPSAAKRAAWSPAPRGMFHLSTEKSCEQEAPLQLLQFAENPQPLGPPFSLVHALCGPSWILESTLYPQKL